MARLPDANTDTLAQWLVPRWNIANREKSSNSIRQSREIFGALLESSSAPTGALKFLKCRRSSAERPTAIPLVSFTGLANP